MELQVSLEWMLDGPSTVVEVDKSGCQKQNQKGPLERIFVVKSLSSGGDWYINGQRDSIIGEFIWFLKNQVVMFKTRLSSVGTFCHETRYNHH